MEWASLFKRETVLPVSRVVDLIRDVGEKSGFLIHNEDKMLMAHTFGGHGVQVAEGFDLHMIQVCKPDKAAVSLQKNPERAALMPKFIMVFTADGKTQIRFLRYNTPMLDALVSDPEFTGSVNTSYNDIEMMIDQAIAI